MKIIYIAKFHKMWDEEYIARGFESLGHVVARIDVQTRVKDMVRDIDVFKPDMVIFAKFAHPYAQTVIDFCKKNKIKTVCWVFDLYWNYARQDQLNTPAFTADYVFTTDGGKRDWDMYGINHHCVRQGIFERECVMLKAKKDIDVLFVGSHNPNNHDRTVMLDKIKNDYNLVWVGKESEDEARGMKLNELYARAKVVVGDSVYAPHYWSNRVVETLGRGGFLIHVEVEGIKDEYPNLVTYKRGDYADLKSKIDYYLSHDKERSDIIKKNFKLVKQNYTCTQKCKELLSYIK